MGKLYTVLQRILYPVLPIKKTVYAEPVGDGPCIFLANHAGAMGPIYMSVTFPHREKADIWCNAGIMDEKEIVEYVRHDWWWRPESKLAPLYNVTVPYIAAAIVPKVMRSAPTIPVYHDARAMSTMRATMKALKKGKHIVIFPERPSGFDAHEEHLQMGWLNLVKLYKCATGKDIRLVPVYIDQKEHIYRIGKSICVESDVPLEAQEARIERAIATHIRGRQLD